MATLALSAIIASGGSVTLAGSTFLATAAAVAIDQFIIYPTLFPVPDQKGQRLSDLQLQDSAEGAASNRPYGSAVRIAGTPVWMTTLREVKNSEGGGGKGGTGGDFIVYQYHVDALIRISKTPKPISRVLKVLADGKDFWEAVPDIGESSAAIEANAVLAYQGNAGDDALELISDMSAGGPDLSELKSGKSVDVDGFTNDPPPAMLGGNTQVDTAAPLGATSLTIKVFAIGTLYPRDNFTLGAQTYVYLGPAILTFNGSAPSTPDVQTLQTIFPPLVSAASIGDIIIPSSTAGNLNNGNWRVLSSSRDDTTNTSIARMKGQRLTSQKFSGKQSGIDTITILQELPTHSTDQVGDVRFFDGSQDQQPDALIIEVEEGKPDIGVGQVMSWRGRACMLVDDLNMTDFGNRLPNFEFIVETDGEIVTIGEVISDILTDAQIGESEFDVEGLDEEFIGFNVRGPQQTKSMLQPIFLAHQLVSYDVDGILTFRKRDSLSAVSILTDDLSAHEPGSQTPSKLKIGDPPLVKLVNSVEIGYRDPEEDYQTKVARSLRTRPIPGADNQRISLDLSLSGDAAQQLADLLFAQLESSSRRVTLTLPPSYEAKIREGLILNVPNIYGQDWRFLVDRWERGSNDLLIVEAIEEDDEVFNQAGTAESGGGPEGPKTQDGISSEAPFIIGYFMDLPPLSDSHKATNGFYIAATNVDTKRAWRGASIYRSTDDGLSYGLVDRVVKEAVVGHLVAGPTITINPGYVDRVNTIRVEIINDGFELSSVTEEEMLRGQRRYLIGNEIIGAASAVLVSSDALRNTKTYDLSILRRGVRDTAEEIDSHEVNERFVWLDGPGVQFVPMNLASVGQADTYKVVAGNGKIALAEPIAVTLDGKPIRPFGVVQITATRDASNNLTVLWEFQTRSITQGLDQGTPLEEDVEKYRIEFLDAGSVVRSSDQENLRSITYLAVEQTADGLTPGDPVDLQIRQLSNRLLEGRLVSQTV